LHAKLAPLSTHISTVARVGGLPSIPALTGLRFFAAFLILFAHAFDWIARFTDTNWRGYFSFVAMYGMPLFFVLSGFVIHYNYRRLFQSQTIARAMRFCGRPIRAAIPALLLRPADGHRGG